MLSVKGPIRIEERIAKKLKKKKKKKKKKGAREGEWRCENFERIERFEIWNYEQFEFKGANPPHAQDKEKE